VPAEGLALRGGIVDERDDYTDKELLPSWWPERVVPLLLAFGFQVGLGLAACLMAVLSLSRSD
jgi:hypothetical protein